MRLEFPELCLPSTFYRTMKVTDRESGVVSADRWFCFATFIANNINDTCCREREQRSCIIHVLMVKDADRSDWLLAVILYTTY